MIAYEPDPTYKPKLEAQPSFDKGMRTKTKEVAASVVVVAPKHTGYYARHVKGRGDRIVASDPFWHLVEFGSVNNPAYRPLARGVRAAGLKYVPTPKHT